MSIDLALVFPRQAPSGDPPLGIASIAAYVRSKGYRVAVVDGTWMRNWKRVAEEVVRLDPAYVGISVTTAMLHDASRIAGRIRLLDQLRGARRQIVVGGPNVTNCPDDAKFLQADHVIQGEGELAVLDLLQGKPPRTERPDLTQLPAPALDLLNMERYIAHHFYFDSIRIGWRATNMLAHRGCPWHCRYCQPTLNRLFGEHIRSRTPQQVIDEVKYLYDRWQIQAAYFQDDTFSIKRPWLHEFMRLTEQLKQPFFFGCNVRADTVDEGLIHEMVVHGLRVVHMGIEAASDRVRNGIYDKSLTLEQIREAVRLFRKYRVHVGGFMILSAPSETEEEMRQTIDLACDLPLDEVSFSICNAIPGTYLADDLAAQGTKMAHDPQAYNYHRNRTFESEVPLKRVRALQQEGLRRFYWHRKGYLLSHLTSVQGVRHLWQKVGRFQ